MRLSSRAWVALGVSFIVGVLTIQIFRAPKAQTWESREAEIAALDQTLGNLARQIQNQQGDVTCASQADCRVVGLGARSCKGHKDFLIYSSLDVNGEKEEELLSTIQAFNKAAERLNDLLFNVGACGVKPVDILCLQKRCVPKG